MKSLALVRTGRAYLPELDAYKDYFKGKYNVSIVFDSDDLSRFDILWYFMGSKGKRFHKDQFIIHEFASLSRPPYSGIKNFIKKKVLNTPDLRVFLNGYVKNGMAFTDNVPFVFRDMGVDPVFNESATCDKKRWDVVYVGAMDSSRKIDVAINQLTSKLPKVKIVLVGDAPAKLRRRYECDNITFLGRVDYKSVPDVIKQAKFALNYVPDVFPYNIQTSTKLLEYIACGTPVISNRYHWVEDFSSKNSVDVVYLDDFSSEHLKKAPIMAKNRGLISQWQEVISNSKLEQYLP